MNNPYDRLQIPKGCVPVDPSKIRTPLHIGTAAKGADDSLAELAELVAKRDALLAELGAAQEPEPVKVETIAQALAHDIERPMTPEGKRSFIGTFRRRLGLPEKS